MATYYLQARSQADVSNGRGWRTVEESVSLPVLLEIRAAFMGRVNGARVRLARINKRTKGDRYTLPKHLYTVARIVDSTGRVVQ